MKALVFVTILLLLLPSTPVSARKTALSGSDRVFTVLSLNVYHGVNAEIFAIPAATDFPDLLQKVAAVYQGYFARNFPERAAALAAEVEASHPDLIGLQEAVLVRTLPGLSFYNHECNSRTPFAQRRAQRHKDVLT